LRANFLGALNVSTIGLELDLDRGVFLASLFADVALWAESAGGAFVCFVVLLGM
jgi:hypothetical protein